MLALSESDPIRKSQNTKIWSILYPVYNSPFYFTSLLTNKEFSFSISIPFILMFHF